MIFITLMLPVEVRIFPTVDTGEYQPQTGQVCGTPAENVPERRVYSGCDNREAPRALVLDL